MVRRTVGTIVISLSILASQGLLAQTGTASVSGKVKNIIEPVAGAGVELRSGAGELYQTKTDISGDYRFLRLPGATYTLKVAMPGYKDLTIKSIQVADRQETSLSTLQIRVGDCGGYPSTDYGRPLTSDNTGDIRGSVRLRRGKRKEDSLLEGADVLLLCSTGAACPSTKTDSKGEFVLKGLLPVNYYALRFLRAGFYPLDELMYQVQAGYELDYSPAYLERCATRDCDPRRRPKKPLGLCE